MAELMNTRQRYRFYNIWQGIKQRCKNPRATGYYRWGGRGISMFPEWEHDYQAFERWILDNLGPRPSGTSLDRIDNDGNYEPGNLRWATYKTQTINQSRHCPTCQCRDKGMA